MKVTLLSVVTSKASWYLDFAEAYNKKISAYCEFDLVRIKSASSNRSQASEKKKRESEDLLSRVAPGDFVILCDEKGKALDSLQFSRKVSSSFENGIKKIVFIIGGAYGVSDDVKKRANLLINLSPMTLNHFVAQIVLMEQIFRAMTIWKNIPYHNE